MIVHLLATLFFLAAVQAKITNTKVTRSVKLDTPGSNLVIFKNDISFQRGPEDSFYYYVIAKDYQWSFVALQVLQNTDAGKNRQLEFEQVQTFPNSFNNKTATALVDNLMIFRIKLQDTANAQQIEVTEFHKGRMEPYPKVIRVYEKQKVEVFDSKYFLSVYPTQESSAIYSLKTSDLHYKS